jgi:hypothetical protein
MSDAKFKDTLEHRAATELINQNVSFDFKRFLNEIGPAPSFSEPLGPSPECLSVDVIRSYHLDELNVSGQCFVKQHVTVCSTCSELLTSYAVPQPGAMPEQLFQRISSRLRHASAKQNVKPAELPPGFALSLPFVIRWVAAPVLTAIVLVWVLYPAAPYVQQTTSRFKDAWLALRDNEAPVPNDPRELNRWFDDLVQASNRGKVPSPHRVDQMVRFAAAKSSFAPADDPNAQLWTISRTQLAAFSALSHYEALRKNTESDVPSLKDLKIAELRDINGVPAVAVDSDQIKDEAVKGLLQRSVVQSGIRRLYVYQGNKMIYDIQAPSADAAPNGPK